MPVGDDVTLTVPLPLWEMENVVVLLAVTDIEGTYDADALAEADEVALSVREDDVDTDDVIDPDSETVPDVVELTVPEMN